MTKMFYLDETWVVANHTFAKQWQSMDSPERRYFPTCKEQCLVVAYTGNTKNKLVDQAQLVFQSISTDKRDYHTEMSGQNIKKNNNWL